MPSFFLKYVITLLLIVSGSLLFAQNQATDTIPKDTIVADIVPADTSAIINVTADKVIIASKKSAAQDTVKVKLHSPKKAAWMSAALPGLGQIYNRKYWKVPVIYVGLGVIGYLGYNYYTKFNKYKKTYLFRSALDTTARDYFPEILSKDILFENWNYYRRNFELTCIFGSLFYILNIIDASVDGHLYKFDISDDLSLKIEPDINTLTYYGGKNMAGGIKLSLKF